MKRTSVTPIENLHFFLRLEEQQIKSENDFCISLCPDSLLLSRALIRVQARAHAHAHAHTRTLLHALTHRQAQVQSDFTQLKNLVEKERSHWEGLITNLLRERQEDAARYFCLPPVVRLL